MGVLKGGGAPFTVRVPGFEPGSKPWQGFVIPGYTTPAFAGELASKMLTTPAHTGEGVIIV